MNAHLTPAQAKVIEALSYSATPLSVKQIAQASGLSDQGTRNQIQSLMMRDMVMRVPSLGKSAIYQLTSGETTKSLSILAGGEFLSLADILESYAKNGMPRNAYDRVFADTVIRLFELSIAALNDDDPVPISFSELRNMSNRGYAAIAAMEKTLEKLKAILAITELWDQRELPKVLIINDTRLDIDHIKDCIYRIQTGTGME